MDTITITGKPMEPLQQRQSAERLKAMIGMWQVFTSISSLFSSTTIEGIPREIENALKVLGSYGKEDRCTLFLLTKDRLYLNKEYTWAAPGARPYPGHFHRLRLDAFPWLCKRLQGLKPLHLPRFEDLPLEAGAWRDFLEDQGIRSLLVIPLVHGSMPMGCLSIESTSRHKSWDTGSISLLRACSGILANACLRKEAEEELSSCRKRLRSLSSDLILAEEKERRRIASDLHDRIGHALAATSMKLKRLEKKASPDLSGAVHDIAGLVEDLIRETQTLTFSISPPVLYDFGLQAAVEWLVEETRRQYGIDIGFACGIEDATVSGNPRILAYQAIREILFNIIKHAKARHVSISVGLRGGRLCTVIEDDGQGFLPPKTSPQKQPRGGFGLFNIREKLRSQGGTLVVESRPDRGTRITMVSPLTDEASA
jgi:signal transduction histidine kinase